jgi:hypothetical protein
VRLITVVTVLPSVGKAIRQALAVPVVAVASGGGEVTKHLRRQIRIGRAVEVAGTVVEILPDLHPSIARNFPKEAAMSEAGCLHQAGRKLVGRCHTTLAVLRP